MLLDMLYSKIRRNNKGMTRAAALLIVLIVIMGSAIAYQAWLKYQERVDTTACNVSLDRADRELRYDYLADFDEKTTEEAVAIVTQVDGRESLCPAGGTVYAVKRDDGVPIQEFACGLHDSDTKERTRLNGTYAKKLLEDALHIEVTLGKKPDVIPVTLNSTTYSAERVEKDTGIVRGSGATVDLKKGTYIYFMADGDEVTYFAYVDDNHAAVWHKEDGWRGDSYSTR